MNYPLDVKVLYAEDDPVISKLTEIKLKRLVKEFYVASNGKEGLELFIKHSPDIVITDINMPEMDGIEMMQKIKELDKDVRIIVTTAYSEIQTITETVRIGIDRYLIKPSSAHEIEDAILKSAKQVIESRMLYESSQHFEAISSFYIISKCDLNHTITFVNDNLCKISGFKRDELISKHYTFLWHKDNPKELENEMLDTLKSKKTWRGIVKSNKKGGGYFVADMTVFSIFDKKGELKEFLVLRQDITELEALREKQKKLELQEEINRAKESFLIMFTHELKTPLNAILNFTEYVIEKLFKNDFSNTKRLIELLNSVKSNAKYMLDTVSNLIDIAKLKSKKLSFNPKLTNLNNSIKELIKSYESLIAEKNINLNLIENNEVIIKTDEIRFKQIFSNLYSNAIKYGNDKIVVTIGKKDGFFELVVEDNGSGIKNKDKIFELYYQEGDVLKRESKGSGVGLYLVKLLCDEMGFEIFVDNSNLGGAKFIIRGKAG